MGRKTLLGPQEGRRKTDLRLPGELLLEVDSICKRLGCPKNAFFALSAGLLVLQLSPLLTEANKRADTWATIENMLQKLLEQVKKSL